jgi:hypothetical protein
LELGGFRLKKDNFEHLKAPPLKMQQAFKDIGLYFGIIGALSFAVWILIFGEDWTHRYRYLNYLIPLPMLSLLLAKQLPIPSGLLLVTTGIGVAVFDAFFSPGYPGQVAGRGLGYTLFFISTPLVISGFFYLILWRKSR